MGRPAEVAGTGTPDPARDDRVLLATRWTGRIIAPILVVAFGMLYGFPDRTTELFAWTVRPEMTPLVMGAGYGTGAYYFYRVATADRWHRVGTVLPGISVFVWFMGIATALHWGSFNHAHPSFWFWAVLYAVGPLLIPAVWIRNDRTDPRRPADRSPRLPRTLALASTAGGIVVTVTAAVLFVVPGVLVGGWPWDLSPLTARVLLGWFALFGVVNLATGLDGRWSAARLPVQTQVLGFSLVLVGAVRARGDFDAANPLTWAFLGGFLLYLLALLAVYGVMERRDGAAPRSGRGGEPSR